MTASFTHISLSNTVNCSQCKKSLSACQCAPNTFTSNLTSFTTSNTSYNYNSIYTNTFTCSGCGNAFGNCSCSYTLQQPLIQPAIMPSTTWTTWNTISSHETISDYIVRSIQQEDEYPATGLLNVLHFDKAEGLYMKGGSLLLPMEYKECFYRLRKAGGYNLWQLRSPLSFRIDLAHTDAPTKQPHFFTLADIEDFTTKGEKTIEITTPFFQEIVDQLELIRLVEIQDTFTKLLRRL